MTFLFLEKSDGMQAASHCGWADRNVIPYGPISGGDSFPSVCGRCKLSFLGFWDQRFSHAPMKNFVSLNSFGGALHAYCTKQIEWTCVRRKEKGGEGGACLEVTRKILNKEKYNLCITPNVLGKDVMWKKGGIINHVCRAPV